MVQQQRTIPARDIECIGITAGISGLKAVVLALSARLKATLPVERLHTPHIGYELLKLLSLSRIRLAEFEIHLHPVKLSAERSLLVPVDQVIASFTNAVLLFSDTKYTG